MLEQWTGWFRSMPLILMASGAATTYRETADLSHAHPSNGQGLVPLCDWPYGHRLVR